MSRRDKFVYNRTIARHVSDFGWLDISGSYRTVSALIVWAVRSILRLDLLSWTPHWLCVFLVLLWPLNYHNCRCCLKKATNSYHHGPALSEVRKAARLGCARCEIIASGISALARDCSTKLQKSGFPEATKYIAFKRGGKYIQINWRREEKDLIAQSMAVRFYVPSASSKVLSDLLVEGGIANSSESDYCFSLIRSWLRKCVGSHESCRSLYGGTAHVVPSRLVHVHDMKLVLGEEVLKSADTRYVALSHCWGVATECKKPIPSTTTLNLDERRKGILWTDLTLSFQHAVTIARELKISYLWIDSICILQDSEEDWAKESAMMGSIYSGALLVISATRSRNGDFGIFHDRQKGTEFSTPSLKGQPIIIREQLTHENFFIAHKPNLDHEPVFSRGWCYQERLLARRVVHYTENEIIWECCEELDCECGGVENEAERMAEGLATRKEFKAKFSKLLGSGDKEERDQCWMHIVEGYSARRLTFEADRLPALSGIAQQVSRPEKGRYLAGMWEADLPNSLLWYPPFMIRTFRDNVTRVSGVPSWSWAATGMAITPHYERGWYMETIADVVEVVCTKTTVDMFGKVSGGHIILEAPVVGARLVTDQDGNMDLVNPNDPSDSCRFFPDSYSSLYLPNEGDSVFCIGIEFDLRPSLVTGFKCLVLRAGPDLSEFQRISQTNCPKKWSERAEKRLMKIV